MASSYGRFDKINLQELPMPDVIEQISFEQIRSDMLEEMGSDWSARALESDPAVKVLEVAAAREVRIRARINDASKAVMLAHSRGADLDHLAALYGVARLVVQEEDNTVVPALPLIMESDADFRTRIQLAPEGFSVAGPKGAYVFFGLAAHGEVGDIYPAGPEDHDRPGEVDVYVLGREPGLEISDEALSAVSEELNKDYVRPLTDLVQVFAAEQVRYEIKASLVTYPGPDSALVLQEAQTRAAAYVASMFKLGHDIRLSAVYGALQVEGVQRVELELPAADMVIDYNQAAYCGLISIELAGLDI